MKNSFGLKARILIIIISLIVMIYLLFSLMLKQIRERDRLIRVLTENYQPSLNLLSHLLDKVEESGRVFNYWMLSPNGIHSVYRDEFNFLNSEVLPDIRNSLISMSDQWGIEDQSLLTETFKLLTDSLYHGILDLVSMNIYGQNKPNNSRELELLLRDTPIVSLTRKINENLNYLLDKKNQEIENISNEISRRSNELEKYIILIFCVLLIFLLVTIFFLYNYLRKFIDSISKNLEQLSKGIVPHTLNQQSKDDISRVKTNMNRLSDYLRNLTLVATRIRQKDYTTEFKPLNNKDELGKAIVDLQESLRNACMEQKKHRKEEAEKLWTSGSIARINDVLRSTTNRIEDIGYEIIKGIVEIIGAKVGGIFLLNDKIPPEIELLPVYAYNRKKIIRKTLMPGEGLIGRCIQENETIYLTDVPEGHLSIKSGLGEAKPVSLLIVPLKINAKAIGALELASFSEFQKYQIDFIEIIAENIAKSLVNLKNNYHTSELLKQKRDQAEKLLKQEEKMKAKMDELRLSLDTFAEREKILLKEIELLKARLEK